MTLTCFLRLLCGGAVCFLSTTHLYAQLRGYKGLVGIGVTHQTVVHAVALRYGDFHYRESGSSSSNRKAQAFHVAQPKFTLPSVQPTRSLAFNSPAADFILSNIGEAIGSAFRSDYRPQQRWYYDKYSLGVRVEP
jgi:hypothetical protein